MVCQYETSEEVGNVELPHLAHSRLPAYPAYRQAGGRQALLTFSSNCIRVRKS